MKRYLFLTVVALLLPAVNQTAVSQYQSFQEKSESYRHAPRQTESWDEGLAGGSLERGTPVGEGLLILLALGGGYAWVQRKNKDARKAER